MDQTKQRIGAAQNLAALVRAYRAALLGMNAPEEDQVAIGISPTNDWMANSLWQQLGVLTHNLVRAFQLYTGAIPRKKSWKRATRFELPSLQTERFELVHQPARLVWRAGCPELRFTVSATTRRRIERTLERIERLAA